MSKLIDADLLRSAFPEPTDWNDIEETIYHIREIWKIIDEQPEVEQQKCGAMMTEGKKE